MKKLKIFHATLLYPSFIEKVYSNHLHLLSASYKTQLNTIINEGTGWLGTWSHYFNRVDDFELETCITNSKSAQLVWAQENEVRVNDTNWKEKVLVSQIQEYSPDILFAHDAWTFKSLLTQLKTIVPSIKLIFGWDGVLLHDLNLYKDYDLIFIGFYGQPLVPIIRLFSSKPILFDAFISSYDTLCYDRKKFKPDSIFGNFFYWLDKHSCIVSNKILLDTNQHIDYFCKTYPLEKKKFERVFVGEDDDMFYPRDLKKKSDFVVFYYSTFQPLHGTDIVVKAAKLLENDPKIKFKIIGKGIETLRIRKLAKKLNIKNIEFVGWVDYKELPLEVGKADICLGGHFGDTSKAKRVISGKTFQFIAMKKATVIGDNKATRELFSHGNDIYMCEMGSADSLAKAILKLRKDSALRNKIALNGYKLYLKECSPDSIGKQLVKIVEGMKGLVK